MIKKIVVVGLILSIFLIFLSIFLPLYAPKQKTLLKKILPENFIILSKIIFKNNIINYSINNYNTKFLPETQFTELNFYKKKITSISQIGDLHPFLIEITNDKLILTDYEGNFFISNLKDINDKSNKKLKKKRIKSNIKTASFYKILDTLIADNIIYISYINKNKNCQNYTISSAQINFDFLEYKKIYHSKECGKNLQAGKMQILTHNNNKGILLTTGDNIMDQPNNSAQNENSIFGKTLFINLINDNKYIFSKGHRNPQGLLIENNLILSTEHGPRGGDEINRIEFKKNYGWPISSYGENYFDKNKKHILNLNKIYDLSFLENEQELTKNNELTYRKNHQFYNFVEPIFSFIPSIGISEIIKLPNDFSKKWQNNFLIASLNGKSLYRIKFDDKFERMIFFEKIIIGQRIRDIKYSNKFSSILLALESNSELGIIKVK